MFGYLISALVGALAGYSVAVEKYKGGTISPNVSLLASALSPTPGALPASSSSGGSGVVAAGEVTPARNELCRQILAGEHRPEKLDAYANLFGQEGLSHHASALASKAGQIRLQARTAAELVERSRVGDQQAWALIETIATDAKSGSVPAQVSVKLMEQYCAAHPAPQGMPDVCGNLGGTSATRVAA